MPPLLRNARRGLMAISANSGGIVKTVRSALRFGTRASNTLGPLGLMPKPTPLAKGRALGPLGLVPRPSALDGVTRSANRAVTKVRGYVPRSLRILKR